MIGAVRALLGNLDRLRVIDHRVVVAWGFVVHGQIQSLAVDVVDVLVRDYHRPLVAKNGLVGCCRWHRIE